VLGARVLDPVLARLQVHWAELPSLDGVVHALDETLLLLLVVHREPVLEEVDARAHQHLLEERTRSQELVVFLLGAEPHDALDAGAVVPAAIEEDDLAARRQVRDIALEIPLPALLLGRRAERHDAADAGIEALGDALDDAALAGRIAALEEHDDL